MAGSINPAVGEPNYTRDQVEFMLAMDRYKRSRSRPYPT